MRSQDGPKKIFIPIFSLLPPINTCHIQVQICLGVSSTSQNLREVGYGSVVSVRAPQGGPSPCSTCSVDNSSRPSFQYHQCCARGRPGKSRTSQPSQLERRFSLWRGVVLG